MAGHNARYPKFDLPVLVLLLLCGISVLADHVAATATSQVTCHSLVGLSADSVDPVADFELSSSHGIAGNVRLNGPTSWKVPDLSNDPFVQIKLSRTLLITGIQTQGAVDEAAFVLQFRMAYSTDCEAYSSDDKTYWANINNETTLTHFFHNVTLAKCVRIFPTKYEGPYVAMRIELLGCDVDQCTNKLGVYSRELLEPTHEMQSGILVKLMSESILTSLAVTYEARAHDNVQLELEYSRTCVEFTTVVNSQMTQLYRTQEGSVRQMTLIAFYTPVRAQCVRVRPVGETILRGVKPYGCDITKTGGTFSHCGGTRRTSGLRRKRVVGGKPVIPGDYPWLVSMHFLPWHNFTNSSGVKHLCGASLIDRQWLLSAAHCFHPAVFTGLDVASNWRVVLGEHDQSARDGTEQVMEVDYIIRHPNFTLIEGSPILFDIALIRLRQPAVLSDYINTVCLDEVGDFPTGTRCIVSGWGQDKQDTIGTKLPFMAYIPIMADSTCRQKYDALPSGHMARAAVHIDGTVFCAAWEAGEKDACFGDSGGPFVCQKDDYWFQVGIVSVGYLCGDMQYPGIYTKTAHYIDWIHRYVNFDNTTD